MQYSEDDIFRDPKISTESSGDFGNTEIFQRILVIIADVLQDGTAVMHLNQQFSVDFFTEAQVSGTIALTVPPSFSHFNPP